MNFSNKMKNYAVLSIACLSTSLTALAPVASANTIKTNTYVKYQTTETNTYTKSSAVDVTFKKDSRFSETRVDVALKGQYPEVKDVFLVLDDYNATPLDRTSSGTYSTNLSKADLKNAKKFHIEVIRKTQHGTHKHIVSHSSFKF